MLVLANGAFKSGSSWLQAILKHIMEFEEIPADFQSPTHKMPWLDRNRIDGFLRSDYHKSGRYLTKSHLYGQHFRKLLLSHDDVLIFDITRDLKDTIVSHYYHFKRDKNVDWSFEKYYWRVGRFKAQQVREYHLTWDEPHPAIYVSSYERLKTSFNDEVKQIGAFLGVDLSEERIAEIKDATSIDKMRKVRGQDKKSEEQRFFRKGAIGDWQNHFDDAMQQDVHMIEQQGLKGKDMLTYRLLFDVRPAVVNLLQARVRPRIKALLNPGHNPKQKGRA